VVLQVPRLLLPWLLLSVQSLQIPLADGELWFREALVLQIPQIRLGVGLLVALAVVLPIVLWSISAMAQDDPNDTPLGDVARNMRKKAAGSQGVIDNDNLSQVMDRVESKHASGSSLRFLMAGESQDFHVAAPDVSCSLSFSANTKALLSSQYAQMDLPPSDFSKLSGPATIEGDALTVSLFNGTNWHVSEVDVALTVVKKNAPADLSALSPNANILPSSLPNLPQSEVRPEKKPDTTVIYRMRAASSPWSKTVFSAPLNLDLAPGDEWHWALVQAKGYPPQGYVAKAELTPTQATTTAPIQPVVIPASLLQQDAPASLRSEDSR
jgi:hypothetical protein